MEIKVVDQSFKRAKPLSGQIAPPPVPVSRAPDKPDFKLCMSCGTKNDTSVRFCNECGDELG